MKRIPMFFIVLLALGLELAGGFLYGKESPRDILGKLADKVDINSLFREKPALSTTLADAVTGVPFLDEFLPLGFESLSLQPRGAGGTFVVEKGGLYAFEAESYCLLPGTHGPGRGNGYLLAPLKGPRAGIIRNILWRAADHPEVPQKDIQVLIWAILARSRIDLDSANLLKTAAALLTPKEIFEVNGGALGLVSDKVLGKALDRISPALRSIFQAESAIRNALSRADTTYDELERIAILDDEGEGEDEGPKIPSGRWSFHPKGYFIRYFAEMFNRTIVEVYCPEKFVIERDSLGRVTTIASPDGERIEMEYPEREELRTVPGKSGVSAFPVTAIRLVTLYPKGVGPLVEAECLDPGWSLSGVPVGPMRPLAESGAFSDLAARLQAAQGHRAEIEGLIQGLNKSRGSSLAEPSEAQWRGILSLYHAVEFLKQVRADARLKHPGWMSDPLELAYRAWQSELAAALRGGTLQAVPGSDTQGRGPAPAFFCGAGNDDSGGGFDEIDLSPDGGQPGDPGTQREGISNRGTPENEKCDGEYKGCKIMAGTDFAMCTAECMGIGEGPLTAQQRLCLVECSRKFSQDQKDCQTLVRHCKGL